MSADPLFVDRLGTLLEPGVLRTFAASAAIGLLIGLERERHPATAAGLRTFTLTALFGTASALLGELVGTAWVATIGLLLVGAMAVVAQPRGAGPDGDPGTTTTVALLLCFVLGAMTWHGLATVAASLAVVVTALLYFKPELKGLTERITRRDMLSILQFGALSLVVLPALPDRGFGPHGALNPYQIWLMVVLVSGVSLVQWRHLPAAAGAAEAAPAQVGNPTELRTAFAFAGSYALVLLLAAALAQHPGGTGLYAVALLAGLTDVAAVTLGSLRLHGVGGATANQAVVAIALACVANIGFKFALAGWIGRRVLAGRSAAGFLASAAALLAAIALLLAPEAAAAVALRQ
ncbi:MAG: MgtC/SapB family protein [Burkholderiaceae bacterium]|nr:MgtC/SapB family protein [Burkholderiaceae bacterium]